MKSQLTDFVRDRYVPFRAFHGKKSFFESAVYHNVVSPFDRKPIAQIGFMTEAQAFENLGILQQTFLSKNLLKTHERLAILKRAAQRVRELADEFADLIAWEGGKPLKDAKIEVLRAVNSLEYAAEESVRIHGEEIPMRATQAASGRLAFTTPEPIGVVLAISAFNHPLNLIVHQVAPALAVGCPVLVKPALETPLTCLHFLDLLYEAGLPVELCLPLIADNAVVEKVVRSNQIAFMTFIGSARVGWHLRSIVAPGVRFALEHGGSAPVVIDESADLDRALPLILRGAFYHSGQVCVSTQRILVHHKRADELTQRLVAGAKALKCGDPRFPDTDCGPLIRERDLVRVAEWVKNAQANGAEVLTGGQRLGDVFFEPTVLRGAQKDDRVLREEIFAPVVHIESFQDLKEAIVKANDVEWSFQAAVFSNNLENTLQAARGLNASAVIVNDSTAFRVDWMPFRGDGPSGFGTSGIPYTMHDMIKQKMIVF